MPAVLVENKQKLNTESVGKTAEIIAPENLSIKASAGFATKSARANAAEPISAS